MNYFTTTIGNYIQNLHTMSLRLSRLKKDGARVDSKLDYFLLGLVDFMDTICWIFYCTCFHGTNNSRVRYRSNICTSIDMYVLVYSIWRNFYSFRLISNALNKFATNGEEVGLFAKFSHLPLSGVLTIIGLCLITNFYQIYLGYYNINYCSSFIE